MSVLRPFCAIRPPVEQVEHFACMPYDVISSEEARAFVGTNSINLLHVTHSEIDLPEKTDIYSDAVYKKAVENMQRLQEEIPLIAENTPRLYIYRQIMGGHVQTGIVGCCSVDEYDSDLIRKHERTRKDKEDDRAKHVLALRMQTEPIFLAYRGLEEINRIVVKCCSSKPLYDFSSSDGVRHIVWEVEESNLLIKEFEKIPCVYVADGHHRAASASRARTQLRSENPSHTGDEEYNYVLAVLFPAEQLRILPYNRVVKDLAGKSVQEFLELVGSKCELQQTSIPIPDIKSKFNMYVDGKWYELKVPTHTIDYSDPIGSLDVSLLQERILAPILGIDDPRTDKRIDFVGGIRGTKELEQLVDSGKAVVAFSMFPTSLDELMKVADINELMPPKSTWFEPKLRSGLFMHKI